MDRHCLEKRLLSRNPIHPSLSRVARVYDYHGLTWLRNLHQGPTSAEQTENDDTSSKAQPVRPIGVLVTYDLIPAWMEVLLSCELGLGS